MPPIPIRIRTRPCPLPSANFLAQDHYNGSEARADIADIILTAERDKIITGIMGTEEVPLIRAEGPTNYEGPPPTNTTTVDELRKNWRAYVSAIDAYELCFEVKIFNRTIGYLYRNSEHKGGIRSFRKYEPKASKETRMANSLDELADLIRTDQLDRKEVERRIVSLMETIGETVDMHDRRFISIWRHVNGMPPVEEKKQLKITR